MFTEKIAKGVAKSLEQVLRVEANSNSCLWLYQPKMPDDIERFRRKKEDGKEKQGY